MPSIQRGSVFKLQGGLWAYRLAQDEQGRRRQVGGFKTKGEARAASDRHLERIRTGHEQRKLTLKELVDEYLVQHIAEDNTIATLRARLKYATAAFGDQPLERLMVAEIAAWRKRLPQGSAWHIMKGLRQVFHYAVAVGLLDDNPAVKVKNPEPKRREVQGSPPGPRSRRPPRSSPPPTRRCRSLPPEPAFDARSGSRSSGAASTGPLASCTSAASTRTGR